MARARRSYSSTSPISCLRRRKTRDLAWRTAAGVVPNSLASVVGEQPSMTTRQKMSQVPAITARVEVGVAAAPAEQLGHVGSNLRVAHKCP